jgi:hypothetical protein
MPLVYVDGFEYAVEALSFSGSSGITTGARTGTNCVTCAPLGARALFTTATLLPGGAAVSDIVLVGFAINTSAGSPSSSIFSTGVGAASPHFRVNLNSSRGLDIINAGGGVQASSSPGLIPAGIWAYIEVQGRIHDTLGQVTIRVNGTTVVSATNFDTKNPASAAADVIWFEPGGVSPCLFDDFYLCTGSLSDPFLGDSRVDTLLPNGNGAVNQFVGSDGNSTDNYLLVDEVPPSSTDYTGSPTVGQQDLYTFADLGFTTGTIHAVCPTFYVAKTEVGARTAKPVLRRTTSNVGTGFTLDTAYRTRQAVYTTDPETSAAWTITNVNALQAGVEVG